jgi:hypothetical protein
MFGGSMGHNGQTINQQDPQEQQVKQIVGGIVGGNGMTAAIGFNNETNDNNLNEKILNIINKNNVLSDEKI